MILGIESSCDETAAAIVSSAGEVRASVVTSQIPIHARFGGVVPELASRNHLVAIRPVIDEALREAGITLDGLEAIAVTSGPGLSGCLLIGLQVAKTIAWARGLPLVPVDHIHAHVFAPFLVDAQPDSDAARRGLAYPYVALAVSGGHTSLCRVDGPGDTTLLGQTLDDAAGEAFDKIAKLMGLPYPGGIYIDRLAESGDPQRFELPRPLRGRGLDFSFSGLKTAARLVWEAHGEPAKADLAASVQEAIVDVLVAKALSACKETGLQTLVVAGGVACNRRLRTKLVAAADKAKLQAFVTPARYCSDNAAMVAGLGAALYAEGVALRGADVLAADVYVTARPARVARGAR